jgi:hypothetical protein
VELMSNLTLIHTLLSVAAIVSGVPALMQIQRSRLTSRSITAFLALAILTSLSGFLLPFTTLTPAVAIAIVALAILAVTLMAQWRARSSHLWHAVFVGGTVASLYLLVFVGVVQAFMKIGPLHAAAPTQSELPFVVTQAVALFGFVALGIAAVRSLRSTAAPTTSAPA